MQEEIVDPITLEEFIEVYQDCDMMGLWDFLVYNAYVFVEGV